MACIIQFTWISEGLKAGKMGAADVKVEMNEITKIQFHRTVHAIMQKNILDLKQEYTEMAKLEGKEYTSEGMLEYLQFLEKNGL